MCKWSKHIVQSDAQGLFATNSSLALTPRTSDGLWWTNNQVANYPYQDLMGKQYKIGLEPEENAVKKWLLSGVDNGENEVRIGLNGCLTGSHNT